MAADRVDDPEVEKLYRYVDLLNDAKDKSQFVSEYKDILSAVYGSNKAKQLSAQLIPRFFVFFPKLARRAIEAQFDLIEADDLGARVQAIRGLPMLCKETPENVIKFVYVLGQLLTVEENIERDAVHKALMSLLWQYPKASLTSLFGHLLGIDENIRDKVINFLRDKVFPLKSELLKPQEEMERHVTDLVKKSLQDVTGAEFKMFIDFLSSLKIFGNNSPPERGQELIEMIEEQADLDSQFNVSDLDQFDRLISCMLMAVPYFMRHPSSSKFLIYLNKHILPVLDKLHEDQKLALLKTLAEISPYAVPQDSRQLLPCIVQLLKKYMPGRKTDQVNYTYMECLLYIFHNLSYKAPNTTNSLCGYRILTGQPSDRLGENFSDIYKDFTKRLKYSEELVVATMEKLKQGLVEYKKNAASKTTYAKSNINTEIQKATIGLRICNNILALIEPLHSKIPAFLGDDKIKLSWKEVMRVPASSMAVTGVKRPAAASNCSTIDVIPAKNVRGAGSTGKLGNKISRGSFRVLKGNKWKRGRRSHGRGWVTGTQF